MENFITKININNKKIYLNYYNNYNKTIKYTKENKEKILIELANNKNNLIKYKKGLKKGLLYANLFTLIDIVKTILSCTYLNFFIFNFFSAIISFYIVMINLLVNLFLISELKGIKEILKSINTSNLPTEIDYLNRCKIINIKDYIKRKKMQEEFNYYDFEYPRYNIKKSLNNQNDNGKILKFKK